MVKGLGSLVQWEPVRRAIWKHQEGWIVSIVSDVAF